MKNFLSTIYIETNSATAEKISIGLIVVTEHKVFFKYSKNKASVLEWFWWYKAPLASKRSRFNLLDHLKQLHVEFTLENKVIKIN